MILAIIRNQVVCHGHPPLCLAQCLQRLQLHFHLISSPFASAQSPQNRKNQACSLLWRLWKDYLKHKLPSDDDLNHLHSYSDVLDVEPAMNLTQEVGDLTGVDLKNSKVIFKDFAEPPLDDLNPEPPPDNPFHSDGIKITIPFFL